MSVREHVFLRTQRSASEVAEAIAGVFDGRADHRDGHSYVVVETARLVAGASGEFGGPILPYLSELPFRSEEEFVASDGYNMEIRLWQAYGKRWDPASGTDIEAAAAAVFFEAVTRTLNDPAIHIRTDEALVAAYLPPRGIYYPPAGTSIYDSDEVHWNGFVLLPDAPR